MIRDDIAQQMLLQQQQQQRRKQPGGLAMLAPLPPLGSSPQSMAQQVPLVGTPPRAPTATAPAQVNLFDQAYAAATAASRETPEDRNKGLEDLLKKAKQYFNLGDMSGSGAP